MTQQDYSISIRVTKSPEEVFNAVNQPQAWWSDSISGNPSELNADWNYHFGDNHLTKLKTIELIPFKKVVWLVLENQFKNARDQSEWVGNRIEFEIETQEGQTILHFTQLGLVPAYDCYKNCEWAWTGFVGKSLHSLIETGVGQLTWYL